MTAMQIQFNYSQAIAQANKLEQIARKLERLEAVSIDGTMGALRNAWQSDNSHEYISKVRKVQGDIKRTSARIRDTARAIRVTAEAVRRAELRALEIARQRNY